MVRGKGRGISLYHSLDEKEEMLSEIPQLLLAKGEISGRSFNLTNYIEATNKSLSLTNPSSSNEKIFTRNNSSAFRFAQFYFIKLKDNYYFISHSTITEDLGRASQSYVDSLILFNSNLKTQSNEKLISKSYVPNPNNLRDIILKHIGLTKSSYLDHCLVSNTQKDIICGEKLKGNTQIQDLIGIIYSMLN